MESFRLIVCFEEYSLFAILAARKDAGAQQSQRASEILFTRIVF